MKTSVLAGVLAFVSVILASQIGAEAQSNALPSACGLLTPAEIRSAIGIAPAAFGQQGLFCTSQSQAHRHISARQRISK